METWTKVGTSGFSSTAAWSTSKQTPSRKRCSRGTPASSRRTFRTTRQASTVASPSFVLRSRPLHLAVLVLMLPPATAEAQLRPFRDRDKARWGYTRPDGSVAISPRYVGAGQFRNGRAPVEDSVGFAIVDRNGAVVERITGDSVAAGRDPVPPPSDRCAWSGSDRFPSVGLECYVRQLRASGAVLGGEITRRPPGGESSSSAVVLKLRSGVLVIEEIGYEGFRRRVILPGVSAAQATEWRRRLYPDAPIKDGCSESWSTGTVRGGAFIEQAAGC